MYVKWFINVKNFVLLYGFTLQLFLQYFVDLNSPFYNY
ncbi:hypothetical protein C7H62_2455 [Mesoflavibacter sp. HG96]|nr:hypothetical protein C7H62_2455 [Mesoflavibacter sp. HG96]QIJ92991.1 hypothetical protein C7H56_2455 [Mesoflavibacter sp. HG37]